MMLKKIGIFFILFLVMGCSKGNNIDASKEFQKRVEKAKSYKIIGNLELQNDEEIFKYNVEVNYLDGNYYKVDMVNKANEHKQIILRNNDGLYVITPSLNKSFKFESTWPDNSSQSYILSSLIKDIKNDNNKEISKNEDGYIIKTTVNYPNNEELKYQKIYLNKDFNLHKVEVYGNDIVKIKFQVEDLDLKAGLSTDLFDLKKYVQVEETDCKDEECTEKQTMGSIETAIYPLYMPSETYLSSSETINTDDNSRIILTYSGGKNFVLVEEGAIKSQEHEIIPVYGEPVILNDTIAALSTNSIYWTSNNIDYYMASEDLSLKEMISIASSMNNSKNVVSLK